MNTKLETNLAEVRGRLTEVKDLESAGSILHWDQATYMPPKGAGPRGRQMALLRRLAHERATDAELGRLLDDLMAHVDELPTDSDEAALIRVAHRDYQRAVRLPASFVKKLSNHLSESYQVWTEARPNNDFAAARPQLEKTLDLSRQYADYFPGYNHIADPLIDVSDQDMTVATIRPLFTELREFLTPLVAAIAERPEVDNSFLFRHYPEPLQWTFGEALIREFGYDFERGRQDKTHHPFMTRFSWGDCRITTRVYEDYLAGGLFATLHEAGHALYELGIDRKYDATPLGEGTSSGVHESQSRMWENVVGRSRSYWEHYYSKLQATFPQQLGSVPLEDFYHAINKVKPSLIRVEADEVTYNLHVIIRFELECELLEGSLNVADLAETWRARYDEYLGVTPPDDRDGVLQDVHWYAGTIGGMFQGYTLGNILTGQFYHAALKANPAIPQEIAQGQFDTLHGWLKENIYRHGKKYTTAELVERLTGGPIRLQPYKDYLSKKYGEIYNL